MSVYTAHSSPIEGQMRGQIYSDRMPGLIRARGSEFCQTLRNIVAETLPLWQRARKMYFLLRHELGSNAPDPSFTRDQHRVFLYAGREGTTTYAHHLVLQLDAFVRKTGGQSPVNLTWCVRNKGNHYYMMSLRRLLEVLSGAPSWRYRPVLEPPAPAPRPKKVVETEFAANRFALLADFELGVGVDDDTWMDRIQEPGYPETIQKVSPEERKYVTQADVNETRRRMGYPPKGVPSIHSDQYKTTKKKVATEECVRSLVKHILIPYCRGVKESGGDLDDLHTTTVRYYFALERWSKDYCVALGVDVHPINWVPGPGILPEAG